MSINLNAILSCVHCGESTPQGCFCVHCGRPLLQACPYEGRDSLIPLVGPGNLPLRRCPQCSELFKVCPLCRRLHRVDETHCVTHRCPLQPTTALEEGSLGGSPRNPRRCWYMRDLLHSALTAPPPLPFRVEQAAYAAEQLVLCVSSPLGGPQLQLYTETGQKAASPPLALSGPLAAPSVEALALSAPYAGVLHPQSASLFMVRNPAQPLHTLPLSAPPFAQAFSPGYWWVLNPAGGSLQVNCYDIRRRQPRLTQLPLGRENIRRVIGAPQGLLVVSRTGDIFQLSAETLQMKTIALTLTESDAAVAGAAWDAGALTLMAHTPRHVAFYRWTPDEGPPQHLHTHALQESALYGPVVTAQTLYFYGPRTLYALRLSPPSLVSETLPGAAEIVQACAITLPGDEHLLLRRRQGDMDRWECWTPGSDDGLRSLGHPFSQTTLSGLTDTGYYQITPSAVQGGGLPQCEMRLWQFV